MMYDKTKVFILSDWFIPGYKAGGPITSLYRMCAQLEGDVQFFVLTNDHDWHDEKTYELPTERWLDVDGIQVFYTSKMGLGLLKKLINEVNPEVVYWNGIYSPKFHALPLIKYLITSGLQRMIVSPRGMLNANAIALKSIKKKWLIRSFDLLGVSEKVHFHSTSFKESESIKKVFPKAVVHQLSNLPPTVSQKPEDDTRKKEGFISVGRISPVKNTLSLIEVFGRTSSRLTLVGSADDISYLNQCEVLLGKNDRLLWVEGVPPSAMLSELQRHQFFISMTTGENFGHAIIEALAGGCPVIISDQTPWNDVEAYGAGWVLPLDNQDAWVERIEACMAMDKSTYEHHSERARSYVSSKFDQAALRQQYIKLFSGD